LRHYPRAIRRAGSRSGAALALRNLLLTRP
jgi:hypothetical protein